MWKRSNLASPAKTRHSCRMRVTNAERAQSVTRSTPSHQHQWGREELQTQAGIKLLIIDVMGFRGHTSEQGQRLQLKRKLAEIVGHLVTPFG